MVGVGSARNRLGSHVHVSSCVYFIPQGARSSTTRQIPDEYCTRGLAVNVSKACSSGSSAYIVFHLRSRSFRSTMFDILPR
jgi:hypothetical protein